MGYKAEEKIHSHPVDEENLVVHLCAEGTAVLSLPRQATTEMCVEPA